MPGVGMQNGAKAGNDSGSSNGWQQTWRRGHECGRCGRWGHYTIGSPGRGTLMRHRLQQGCAALAPAARARGVLEAPGTTGLIAPGGLALQGVASDQGAAIGAIALAAIAVAAHEHLGATTPAHEESGRLVAHGHPWQTKGVLDGIVPGCKTNAAPVIDTV